MITAAIRYETDGYVTSGSRLMGRQSAGLGMLRAIVAAADPHEGLTGIGPNPASAAPFSLQVGELRPGIRTSWIGFHEIERMATKGVVYTPDPNLGTLANLRLRTGVASFSITGVTHTTATAAAMGFIGDLVSEPVMPWDALICTSQSVRQTVNQLLDAKGEYLRWRTGGTPPRPPLLPIIPLGVHRSDFEITKSEKEQARAELGLTEETRVFLFLGRLSAHAKAHPYPILRALNSAAHSMPDQITFIQCGWFANEQTERMFKEAAQRHAPKVKCLFLDGRQDKNRRTAWASADVFVTLADNIQETFGLTPLEAMAAGLPVIASDWDGYRETVRNGIDGILIPTIMPGPGNGKKIASDYEAGIMSYDNYCLATSQTIAIDQNALEIAVVRLAKDRDLCLKMGSEGKARVRQAFDWSVVMKTYQQLWAECDAMRMNAQARGKLPSFTHAPTRPDPYDAFAHYATRLIGPESRIRLLSRDWQVLEDPLFRGGRDVRVDLKTLALIRDHLAVNADQTLSELARSLGIDQTSLCLTLGHLTKANLISITG